MLENITRYMARYRASNLSLTEIRHFTGTPDLDPMQAEKWANGLSSYIETAYNDERKLFIEIVADYNRNRKRNFLDSNGKIVDYYRVSYTQKTLIDGLQRSTAISDYINNHFALSKDTEPLSCCYRDDDGNIITENFDLAGKKFKALPDVLKEAILEYRLTVYSYEGFSDDELDDIVFCVNNGSSFKPFQKMRTVLGSAMMEYLQLVCDGVLWEKAEGIKAKNDNILGCVVRTLMLLKDYPFKSLSTSEMTKFAEEFSENGTPEKDYYSIEEAQHLMELFNQESEENYKYVCFFILAIYTGFRLGELLGLEWKDVNFETNVITVNRTCLYSKAKGGLYTETPKTKQSMRSLKVPQGVIDMLKKWYDLQDKQRKKVGSKWIETDRIFTKWNGLTLDRTAPGYYYKRFCERTGMRYVSTHSMRHLNAGIDVKTVQSCLGHSTATTTVNIPYGHTYQNSHIRQRALPIKAATLFLSYECGTYV